MGTVLKVDIDFKPPEAWLIMWIETRCNMLKSFGFSIKRIYEHQTKKGQNYFIEIDKELTAEKTNMIQFLLGDDYTRVKINAWRIERGISNWNKIFDRKLWRKSAKAIECWYCGNKIPLIKERNTK